MGNSVADAWCGSCQTGHGYGGRKLVVVKGQLDEKASSRANANSSLYQHRAMRGNPADAVRSALILPSGVSARGQYNHSVCGTTRMDGPSESQCGKS
jgi:hypothetical protein